MSIGSWRCERRVSIRVIVEVALHVHRIFRRDGQSAVHAVAGAGSPDTDALTIDDFQRPAEKDRRVLAQLPLTLGGEGNREGPCRSRA